jgi:hypothetical protein
VTEYPLPAAPYGRRQLRSLSFNLRYERTKIPSTWTVEKIPRGLKVTDANGQSLAYVYSRENPNAAHMAKVLTEDEARRIASDIAKLPTLLGKGDCGIKLRSY